MNERIKELEKQSYITFKDENSFDCLVFSKEKFAELILFECIKLAVFRGDKETARAIKEHFGVEWGEEKLTGNDVGYVVKKHFGVE